MTDRQKLWFCFPYRDVGGVSLLFLRVAEELARTGAADVVLVDYADGYMARHRDPALSSLAIYTDEGPLDVPEDAIVVFQSMTPWSIFPGLRLHDRTRLFFWNCHPFNLVPTFPGLRARMQGNPAFARLMLATLLRGYAARMRRFVRLLIGSDSLVFMDRPNLEVTEESLGIRIEAPQFLPIPAPEVPERTPLALEGALRIVWIGRIVDFKYYSLLHALLALNDLAPTLDRSVEVTIVGTGDYREKLRAEAAGCQHLAIAFVDELAPSEVDAILKDRTDMLLAMGTAALEGAKLGVPTLLLDIAYGPLEGDHRYGWLHEQEGFTLGDRANRAGAPREPDSMRRRIGELLSDPKGLGARSVSHFREFHALSVVATALSSRAASARCRWGDLRAASLDKRGRAYPIFVGLRKLYGKR